MIPHTLELHLHRPTVPHRDERLHKPYFQPALTAHGALATRAAARAACEPAASAAALATAALATATAAASKHATAAAVGTTLSASRPTARPRQPTEPSDCMHAVRGQLAT